MIDNSGMNNDGQMQSRGMKRSRTVKIRVPGTSANCGSGFDTLGVACTLYNNLELTLFSEPTLIIENEGAGKEYIATDERNMVWRAIVELLKAAGKDKEYLGAHIRMTNDVPLSRGIGSSAAAIVAGLKGANVLIDNYFNRHELFQIATKMEGHPDNVAPAIFGGFTVSIMSHGIAETFSFMPRMYIRLVIAVPDFPLSTKAAREALPKNVSMRDAVFNIGRASMLVAALSHGNEKFLRHAFDDKLHQPYRAKLIPGMYDVFHAARAEGALGVSISGAGSSLIAYTHKNEEAVGDAMREAFKKNGVDAKILHLGIDKRGAHIVNHDEARA